MITREILQIGLSTQEAELRLKQFGNNSLPENKPPSDLKILISQLKSPLVYILFFAGTVTLLLSEFADALIIFLAVFINTLLGFVQERKANRSLEALKKMLHPTSKVIRDYAQKTIESEFLVPGDIVVLHQGDKIPADGKLVMAHKLYINESILTGESVLGAKHENDEVYMGATVLGGNGVFRIFKTGINTEMGKIAHSVSNYVEETPLTKQLAKFSSYLTYLIIVLVTVIFVIGLIKDKALYEVIATSVALAVSAIPEGLLIGLTAVLAIGMQRILKRKGLVRNLLSAETLGGVTTICIDKTGTLTYGSMEVTDVLGELENIKLQMFVANDLDDPIVISGYEWAKQQYFKELKYDFQSVLDRHKRFDTIPFSSEARLFASLNKFDHQNNVIFVNGAPEVLLNRSTLNEDQKHFIYSEIDRLTSHGKRLLGLGRKKVSSDQFEIKDEDLENSLEWVGIVAFNDPVRPDVRQALEDTRKAGIKLVVITGDYAKTAVSVLRELGLEILEGNIVLGDQINEMADDELKRKLLQKTSVKLFARTRPEQKYRIVELLKANGEVVAMMGDGVNDAPALAKADIGIVVGEASEVAKESSDLILLDSSFSTIVAAIEEGRGIFNNIRKIVLYLLCDSFVGIVVVLGSMIYNLPLPITAAQLLWINLLTDGFPHISLTIDPKNKDCMSIPPRSPKEPLVASWMNILIAIVSVASGFTGLIIYFYVYVVYQDYELARSAVFAAIGVNSLVYVFSVRNLREPFWKENIFRNKWLVYSVLVGFILILLPFANSTLMSYLELKPLGNLWFYVFISSFIMFFIIEVSKMIFDKVDVAGNDILKR